MDIQKFLAKYNLNAKKSLGQNFLKNQFILEEIVRVAEVSKEDNILEIGPGLGTLTNILLQKAKMVLALELDTSLFNILQNEFYDNNNLKLLNENVLNLSNQKIVDEFYKNTDTQNNEKQYKVVANIPYNITSPILRKFTEQKPIPDLCVLLVQKEVAKRVVANKGELSILGIATQFYAKVEYMFDVNKKEFFPIPKVDSAVIKLQKDDFYLKMANKLKLTEKEVFKIVKIGFSSKRKQLHNNLSAGLHIDSLKLKSVITELNLSELVRAQELSIEQWIFLTKRLRDLFDVV